MFRGVVAAVLVVFSSAVMAAESPLSFRAGAGYDYFSQRFFLDSLSVAGEDTVLTKFQLTSEYLNDLKGIVEGSYHHPNRRRFDLTSRLEQTDQITRLKLTSNWLVPTSLLELRLRNQLDWRWETGDSTASSGGYLAGSSSLRARRPLGASTALWGQFQLERTDFTSQQTSGYDFTRVGAKVGLERDLGLLSLVSVNGFVNSRQVADTTTLDYGSYGVEAALTGTTSLLDFDLMTRWESRDYDKPQNDDDYNRWELDSRSKVRLGQRLYSGQKIELEVTSYDPSDELNQDYTRLGGGLTLGYSLGALDLAAGPDFELYRQAAGDSLSTDDYLESAGLLEANLATLGGLFLSTEQRIGVRNLDQPSEYQSDFSFYELTALGSYPFSRHFDFSLLLSSTWEWHDESSEDNQATLVSTSLFYRF